MSRSERRRQQRDASKGHPWKDERHRDLEGMQGCDEADQAQAGLLMMGGITPIKCPHCGEVPVFGEMGQNIDPDMPGYEPN